MSNQGRRQASVRAVTGTSLDYNGDFMALFDLAGIPAGDRVATGTSLTFNTLATGLNPTVRVTHNTLTNGHPIVGSQITFANASGAINGVTLNGTWTITAVLNSTNSNCQYEFVATGQTASATGSGAITIDTTYSAANIFPTDTWIRFGFYAEAAAWDKWRNIQMIFQPRNGASGIISYRAGRTYDSNMRFMPSDAWSGWIVSDPIKLDSEALSTVTNFFIAVNADVENSVSGTASATLGISRPFFRVISNPTTDWVI